MLLVLFSAQFMNFYITILQIIVILGYYPLNYISNEYSFTVFPPITFFSRVTIGQDNSDCKPDSDENNLKLIELREL